MRKNYRQIVWVSLFVIWLFLFLSCHLEKEITRPEEPRPQSWISMGLQNLEINRIKVIGDWVYVCTRQNGLLRSSNYVTAEADWHYLGLANLRVEIGYFFGLTDVVVLGDTLVASVNSGKFSPAVSGIYRSINDGKTWVKSDSGFYTDQYFEGTANVIRLIQSPKQPHFLLAACCEAPALVYLSKDFGRSWKLLFPNTTAITFYAAAFHPLNLNEIWVGGHTSMGRPLLYRSTDQGTTWQEILKWPYDPDVSDMVNDIVFEPHQGQILYICMNYFILSTTDAGQTWIASDSLYSVLWNMEINPYNINELIACGSDSLYHTIDNGNNWILLSIGPENFAMNKLAVGWENRILYINTYKSKGIFKLFF